MWNPWRRWIKKRIAEAEVRTRAHSEICAATVERLLRPLIDDGRARLIREEGKDYVEFTVLPRNEGSARFGLAPGPWYHDLWVGPQQNVHEIDTGKRNDREWVGELEACISAIVFGRYREQITPNGRRLEMTFEIPGGEDIVVTHMNVTGEDGSNAYGKPGIHTYEAY